MDARPNIVIFNPDHFRADGLAHLGHPWAASPNLDRIAAEDGVSFANAFCQNPVCTPSRCSFMTGLYPHVRGHRTMHHMLHPERGEPNLLKLLKDEGYFVWWGGKNDLVPAQDGFDAYCDVHYRPPGPTESVEESLGPDWRGEPDSDTFYSFFGGRLESDGGGLFHDRDAAIVAGAVEFLRDRPTNGPFCLFLPLSAPHPPYAVEEPFYSVVDRDALPPRIPTPEDWAGKASILKGTWERSNMGTWTEERWRELRAVFYGMCARVDHLFGMVVGALKEAGTYDETAVFFFSDHATYAGDYGLADINQNTFEDVLIHVPLVVKPPAGVSVRPGVRDALVELVDFPATVLDLLGITPSFTHFGRSLLTVIAGERDEHRDAVFCEGGRLREEAHCKELESADGRYPDSLYWPRLSLQAGDGPEHTKAVMCRTRGHKYVMRLYEEDEFYDLERDPHELVNRIGEAAYAEAVREHKDRLLRFFLETADAVPHEPDCRWPGELG
jgi:arylsulfatase A-like enzyme